MLFIFITRLITCTFLLSFTSIKSVDRINFTLAECTPSTDVLTCSYTPIDSLTSSREQPFCPQSIKVNKPISEKDLKSTNCFRLNLVLTIVAKILSES